jgi:hypothetical protein
MFFSVWIFVVTPARCAGVSFLTLIRQFFLDSTIQYIFANSFYTTRKLCANPGILRSSRIPAVQYATQLMPNAIPAQVR